MSGGVSPSLGNPTRLLARRQLGAYQFGFDAAFAVSADGRRVLTTRGPETAKLAPRLAVVQNWASEFRDRRSTRTFSCAAY